MSTTEQGVTPTRSRRSTPLMTADEVAAILRLPSRRSVYSLVDQGLLPYVSVGRHLRFSEDHLAELYRRSAEAAS